MADGNIIFNNLFNSFRAMPTPVAGTDCNTIKTPGVYEISYSPSYPNAPIGDNGYLIVFARIITATNTQIMQVWIGTYSNTIQYRRFRDDVGWTNWKAITAS